MVSEKIVTLQKEREIRNITNSLNINTKIKLDTSISNVKFFEKAVKEIASKYFPKIDKKESTLMELTKKINNEFQYFNIEVKSILSEDEYLLNIIGSAQVSYLPKTQKIKIKKSDIVNYTKDLEPIECTISDHYGNKLSFYSMAKTKINSKSKDYYFKYNEEKIRILDFYSTIAEVYIINEIINYNKTNSLIVSDIVNDNASNKKKYKNSYINYIKNTYINSGEGIESILSNFKNSYEITKEGFMFLTGYSKEVLGAIFKEIAKDNEDILIQEKQLSNMNSEYAKAFELKKNINKETINAMKKSLFNQYFKEVEFDNDVDLNKIKQIEREFQDTLDFLNPDDNIIKFMKEVTLRFRYLGKYKAAGIYFPFQKSLCVDVRDPSAFLHEFMHMIDYSGYKIDNYKISSKYNFRTIKNKYIELLDKIVENLPIDNSFRKRYYGTTKYNRDYYCNSVEIFARCGEIYLNKILKVDNSLVKQLSNDSYVYPQSNDLDNVIKEYYSDFFNIKDDFQRLTAKTITDYNNVSIVACEQGQFRFDF